ncbi:trypsin-like peptidase domain-containing protein [Sphingomonas sp.]|uniref:trypsin-like peptidase domain-containing protein n=1 Tax=Sphingomonas sp. TaxID=28214 RepID=UPI001ECA3B82|nr:trypsin-like peptidase domain-containing protein [Sphingomonas sp.]MBX3594822.1 trypsin-like peptidase domain-containing protein [Sphingomonas sp.]
MTRLLLAVTMILAWIAPARADDISAAGRGVVRIVTIAMVDGEVVGFGHGSGFAVAPNRVLTNAHVVEAADRYPGNVMIGVVPSEGDKSFQGRLIAIDPVRDLALIEFSGIRLPPLTFYNGPVNEGDAMIALGYPGNVDLATARTAADFITPLSPVRSQGVFSGRRDLQGVQVLLHTAGIARGNSGGPLLDGCGRVLGVNAALTRADDGDASFGFAISNEEVAAFLRESKQPMPANGVACTSIAERLAQDRSEAEKARMAEEVRQREAAARAADDRDSAIQQARSANIVTRENYMAAATLLLVLGALAIGAGGLFLTRGQQREAIWTASGGGVLMIGAIVTFFMRPAFDAKAIEAGAPIAVPAAIATGGLGKMVCSIDPARSRITVSDTRDQSIDINPDGCVNGRTQYAEAGQNWQRILVPDEEQTVSVLEYAPTTRTYSVTRYLLSAKQMGEARKRRAEVKVKACSAEPAARADLAAKQQVIRTALPPVFNERLVYSCKPAG